MLRDEALIHEVLNARDKLQQIVSGEMVRGRRVSQYDMKPGKRPMKPAEIKELAKRTAERLNAAVNAFQDSQPKPWEWDEFDNKY